MNLHTTTHAFEFLTPAWLGGATPAERAEVRIATLRGHLRQWLRLLYPSQNLDEILLGRVAGVGRNTQTNSSRVVLQLEKTVQSGTTKNLVSYIGAKDNDAALRDPESYFLWPLRTQSRGVLLPGLSSEFILKIRWYPTLVNRGHGLQTDLSNALSALGLLGCIGTRATRGYGSLWEKDKNIASEQQLRDHLAFLPPSISVQLLDGMFDDGRKALAAGAKWMRSFRVGSATYGTTTGEAVNDHDVADPGQAARNSAQVYRHVLGMPLAQRFNRGRDNTTIMQSKYRHDGQDTDRYPSPLRIKVIRMQGKHRVLIVLLRDLLLSEETPITLTSRSERRTATLSHQLLNKMMRTGTSIH